MLGFVDPRKGSSVFTCSKYHTLKVCTSKHVSGFRHTPLAVLARLSRNTNTNIVHLDNICYSHGSNIAQATCLLLRRTLLAFMQDTLLATSYY